MGNPPIRIFGRIKIILHNGRQDEDLARPYRSVIRFARLVGHFDQAIKASRVGSCFDYVLYSLLCMRFRWSCKLVVPPR